MADAERRAEIQAAPYKRLYAAEAEVARLKDEVERLRAALLRITYYKVRSTKAAEDARDMQAIAREAARPAVDEVLRVRRDG